MLDFLKKTKNLILIFLWCAMTAALVAGIGLNAARSAEGLPDDIVYCRLWFALACYAMMGLPYLAEFFFRMRLPFLLEIFCPLFSFFEIGAIVFGLYPLFPAWDLIMGGLGGALLSAVGFTLAELILKDLPFSWKKITAATVISFLFALGVSFLKVLLRLCLGLLPILSAGNTLAYMGCLLAGAGGTVFICFLLFRKDEKRFSAFSVKKRERI